MKKTTLLAAISLLSVAAASGSAHAQSGGNVALVLGVKGSPFYQALQCGAQAKAKELGLTLTVSAPDQFAADSQIPVVNAVTATKPDVAAIVPTDTQALVAPMKQLADMGAKVITVDQTINDTSFVQTQVLTDNEAGGKMAAVDMNDLLGGKGKVLVITQPPGSAAQDARVTGFEEQIKTYSGIEYLGPQYQSDDPQKAAEIVTSTLSAHPDLAGIFSTNDQGAIGAITGLRQAGAAGKIKVIAYDAATAEVNAFKNGQIHALIAQDPKQEGEVAMEIAAKLIKGEKIDKVTMTDIVSIKAGDTAAAEKYEYKADCM
ncbi:ABC transporter substrate-binding protein [Rhizobium leguminosarum]|uniref:ABC transporter substrate-binding protein n=1 Tax=Rhizobium TaxID=379 RepID=UPI001031B87B|nr:ABC transporter substrate-binding protein [Rhizobium leguminosarum]TBF70745.1 sugar ABC transporter substrate-binding protein [Rhizobium leguminosarum]TBG93385.1 sugar ABC transporter substrate-binding protein [Rhizobium leguminosarum]TBG95995.1 sugar ABC transporter substrate-binding protein [Rhizobium leguminosarum]TBH28765.1 sugar ABC transporter substrate-binding protein [Rhizobium leguminosarum]TBH50210.1 sugar ABC transporter substrate-binding protein [Rhizobium leguminosarum]